MPSIKQEAGSEFDELMRDIRSTILKAHNTDSKKHRWWSHPSITGPKFAEKLLRLAELVPNIDGTVTWLLEFKCPCVCHRTELVHNICPCENGITGGGSRT